MSHSIHGNIIYTEGFKPYQYKKLQINEKIINFIHNEGGIHSALCGEDMVAYAKIDEKGEECQPFFYTFYSPRKLNYILGNVELDSLPKDIRGKFSKENSLVIRVESGSHVSVKNKILATQIYDASKNLLDKLAKEGEKIGLKKSSFDLIFDDESYFFTPSQFIKEIGIRR